MCQPACLYIYVQCFVRVRVESRASSHLKRRVRSLRYLIGIIWTLLITQTRTNAPRTAHEHSRVLFAPLRNLNCVHCSARQECRRANVERRSVRFQSQCSLPTSRASRIREHNPHVTRFALMTDRGTRCCLRSAVACELYSEAKRARVCLFNIT